VKILFTLLKKLVCAVGYSSSLPFMITI
jgi:hypothetical protein